MAQQANGENTTKRGGARKAAASPSTHSLPDNPDIEVPLLDAQRLAAIAAELHISLKVESALELTRDQRDLLFEVVTDRLCSELGTAVKLFYGVADSSPRQSAS
jgi:hypothetical protein